MAALTEERRDDILLELLAGQRRLEFYVKVLAGKLLAPAEIAEIEAAANSQIRETVLTR